MFTTTPPYLKQSSSTLTTFSTGAPTNSNLPKALIMNPSVESYIQLTRLNSPPIALQKKTLKKTKKSSTGSTIWFFLILLVVLSKIFSAISDGNSSSPNNDRDKRGNTSERDEITGDRLDKSDQVHKLYLEANEFYSNRQWQQAINKTDLALAIHSNSYASRLLRGRSYFEMQNYQQALQDFNHLIKSRAHQNTSYEAYITRSRVHLSLNSYDLALEDIDAALELDSHSDKTYIDKARILGVKGDYNKAINLINQLQSVEYNEQALVMRSWVYSKLGDKANMCRDTLLACDLGNKESCEYKATLCQD